MITMVLLSSHPATRPGPLDQKGAADSAGRTKRVSSVASRRGRAPTVNMMSFIIFTACCLPAGEAIIHDENGVAMSSTEVMDKMYNMIKESFEALVPIKSALDNVVANAPGLDANTSDGVKFPPWTELLTSATASLAGMSKNFQEEFRKVLNEKLKQSGEGQNSGSLRDALSLMARTVLKITPNIIETRSPSRQSFTRFMQVMRDIKDTASRRVVTKEIDENEKKLDEAKSTSGGMNAFAYANVVIVAAVLVCVVVGFSGWFGFVRKRAVADRASRRTRAMEKGQRIAESRLVDKLANEVSGSHLVPMRLQPSAPERDHVCYRN